MPSTMLVPELGKVLRATPTRVEEPDTQQIIDATRELSREKKRLFPSPDKTVTGNFDGSRNEDVVRVQKLINAYIDNGLLKEKKLTEKGVLDNKTKDAIGTLQTYLYRRTGRVAYETGNEGRFDGATLKEAETVAKTLSNAKDYVADSAYPAAAAAYSEIRLPEFARVVANKAERAGETADALIIYKSLKASADIKRLERALANTQDAEKLTLSKKAAEDARVGPLLKEARDAVAEMDDKEAKGKATRKLTEALELYARIERARGDDYSRVTNLAKEALAIVDNARLAATPVRTATKTAVTERASQIDLSDVEEADDPQAQLERDAAAEKAKREAGKPETAKPVSVEAARALQREAQAALAQLKAIMKDPVANSLYHKSDTLKEKPTNAKGASLEALYQRELETMNTADKALSNRSRTRGARETEADSIRTAEIALRRVVSTVTDAVSEISGKLKTEKQAQAARGAEARAQAQAEKRSKVDQERTAAEARKAALKDAKDAHAELILITTNVKSVLGELTGKKGSGLDKQFNGLFTLDSRRDLAADLDELLRDSGRTTKATRTTIDPQLDAANRVVGKSTSTTQELIKAKETYKFGKERAEKLLTRVTQDKETLTRAMQEGRYSQVAQIRQKYGASDKVVRELAQQAAKAATNAKTDKAYEEAIETYQLITKKTKADDKQMNVLLRARVDARKAATEAAAEQQEAAALDRLAQTAKTKPELLTLIKDTVPQLYTVPENVDSEEYVTAKVQIVINALIDLGYLRGVGKLPPKNLDPTLLEVPVSALSAKLIKEGHLDKSAPKKEFRPSHAEAVLLVVEALENPKTKADSLADKRFLSAAVDARDAIKSLDGCGTRMENDCDKLRAKLKEIDTLLAKGSPKNPELIYNRYVKLKQAAEALKAIDSLILTLEAKQKTGVDADVIGKYLASFDRNVWKPYQDGQYVLAREIATSINKQAQALQPARKAVSEGAVTAESLRERALAAEGKYKEVKSLDVKVNEGSLIAESGLIPKASLTITTTGAVHINDILKDPQTRIFYMFTKQNASGRYIVTPETSTERDTPAAAEIDETGSIFVYIQKSTGNIVDAERIRTTIRDKDLTPKQVAAFLEDQGVKKQAVGTYDGDANTFDVQTKYQSMLIGALEAGRLFSTVVDAKTALVEIRPSPVVRAQPNDEYRVIAFPPQYAPEIRQ